MKYTTIIGYVQYYNILLITIIELALTERTLIVKVCKKMSSELYVYMCVLLLRLTYSFYIVLYFCRKWSPQVVADVTVARQRLSLKEGRCVFSDQRRCRIFFGNCPANSVRYFQAVWKWFQTTARRNDKALRGVKWIQCWIMHDVAEERPQIPSYSRKDHAYQEETRWDKNVAVDMFM